MAYGIAQQSKNWIDLRRKEISVGSAEPRTLPTLGSSRPRRMHANEVTPKRPFIPWILYNIHIESTEIKRWNEEYVYTWLLETPGSRGPEPLTGQDWRRADDVLDSWKVRYLPDAVFDAAGPGPCHWPTNHKSQIFNLFTFIYQLFPEKSTLLGAIRLPLWIGSLQWWGRDLDIIGRDSSVLQVHPVTYCWHPLVFLYQFEV